MTGIWRAFWGRVESRLHHDDPHRREATEDRFVALVNRVNAQLGRSDDLRVPEREAHDKIPHRGMRGA